MPRIDALYLTCEHGGNRIPARWRKLFSGHEGLLESHRGWDPGALTIARQMAKKLDAPIEFSTTSRLLVELNRSIGHPSLFSAITKPLPHAERERILAEHYFPYRARIEKEMAEIMHSLSRRGALLHISVHTFTPVLNGEVRNTDIGLLYDPRREGEREFARQWRTALHRVAPELRVRLNYPYRGAADGFTTHLRKRFPASRYLGFELEINQAIATQTAGRLRKLENAISGSVSNAIS